VITRRKFVTVLGLGAVAPRAVFADQEKQQRPDASFISRILSDHPVAQPLHRPEPSTWRDDTITAAWIGHATVLINFFGTTIITDPVFSEKIGINLLRMFTLGPKRLTAPALPIGELPPIDLILLSHAHMDHLDLPSLRQFDRSIPTVMAKNTRDVIDSLYREQVTELDWGEKITIGSVTIEAFRTKHFGWRFPWESDRTKGDWNGRSFNAYLLTKNGKRILFGGDTAYQEYFKAIGERNVEVDLAIMPIGAYDPWIRVHANPEEALAMANHARARAIMPIHWNTFTLSNEPQQEPIERLKAALAAHSPTLALDDVGKTWSLAFQQTASAQERELIPKRAP